MPDKHRSSSKRESSGHDRDHRRSSQRYDDHRDRDYEEPRTPTRRSSKAYDNDRAPESPGYLKSTRRSRSGTYLVYDYSAMRDELPPQPPRAPHPPASPFRTTRYRSLEQHHSASTPRSPTAGRHATPRPRRDSNQHYERAAPQSPTPRTERRSSRTYVLPKAPSAPLPQPGKPTSFPIPVTIPRPAGLRTPSPSSVTDDGFASGEFTVMRKAEFLALIQYDPRKHKELLTRTQDHTEDLTSGWSYISNHIFKSREVASWSSARRSSVLVVETGEIQDMSNYFKYHFMTGVCKFSIDVVEYYRSRKQDTACLYLSCALNYCDDNGNLLLRQLLGQAVSHPFHDLTISRIKFRGSPDALLCFDKLAALLFVELLGLLEQAPVVISIDSIQSYESGAAEDRNVRTVLYRLVEMAGREGKYPLKVLITTAWREFRPLQEGEKITTTYKLPAKVKEIAWKHKQ